MKAALVGPRLPWILRHPDSGLELAVPQQPCRGLSRSADCLGVQQQGRAQRLRENDVPVEVMVFPVEIHVFLMFKTWLKAYGATADFFVRYLN